MTLVELDRAYGVYPPVQIGLLDGNELHCLEPVVPAVFTWNLPPVIRPKISKTLNLSLPEMERQFIPEMDAIAVDDQVPFELLHITDIIDSLLEFSAEAGSYRANESLA